VIPFLLIFLRYHVGKDAKNKGNNKRH
jgi:hypothetical protein